jgi:hypothetical protein
VAAALDVNTMAVSGAFTSKVGMGAGAGEILGMTHANIKINKIEIEIENIF